MATYIIFSGGRNATKRSINTKWHTVSVRRGTTTIAVQKRIKVLKVAILPGYLRRSTLEVEAFGNGIAAVGLSGAASGTLQMARRGFGAVANGTS